ncbi:MAG: tetratricopeptide repeat protein [Candidatus Omnitrophica bacterium]|nr:tetratricopeptide repeat protein [Candidatus Omnitrophota bacterium]
MKLRIILPAIILLLLIPLSGVLAVTNNAKEEETLFMAKKAFEDGFYEVSLGLLERFLKNYSNSDKTAQANLLIAECYFHQNKFLDALAKFESLLDKPESKALKDEIYYGIAEVYFKGGDFNKAATYYKNIINEFPNSSYLPAAHYSLGWSLFQNQKFKDAVDSFQVLESKYPKEAQTLDATFKIVECLYNLKEYATLRDKINSSIKLFAKDPLQLAYLNFFLGEAYYYLGNFNEAVYAYSKAQVDNHDGKMLALCKLDLAWAYIKLKRYKEAEDILFKIKQSDLEIRSQEAFLLGEAILMMDTNRVNQASSIYDKLTQTASDPLILAQAYIGKADAFYNLADYKGAIIAYQQALQKVSPDDLPADAIENLHYNFSWALFKEARFNEAIKEFEVVVAQAKDDSALRVSTLCQIGDSYLELGQYNKAQKIYNSVLKEYPNTACSEYAQYQLGTVLLKDSNYKSAVSNLISFTKNYPSSKYIDQAAYRVALAYFQKGDYSATKEFLNEFGDQFKDNSFKIKSLFLLGNSLYNLGDYTQALQVFRGIVNLGSQDPELAGKAEYEIADCYYQIGDEKEALNRFKTLRSKYPDSNFAPEVIWWLGNYYYQHNESNLARRHYLSIIKDFPKNDLVANAYYALGLTFAEENRLQEALDNFTKAQISNKADLSVKIAIAMGGVYVGLEKSELAISLYRDTLQRYPNSSKQIYPEIAELYFKTGDYINALNYYQKSLELSEVNELPALHLKIAEIYEAQSKLDAAIEEYLRVAESPDQDAGLIVKALLRIGQIYEDKENFKEALKYYRRISSMDVQESKFAQERVNQIKGRP